MAGTSQKNNTTRTSAASGQKKTNASRSTTGGSSRATASNRNTNGKSGAGSRSTLAKNGGNSRSASGRNANTGTRNASTSQGASARQSAPKPRPQYESFLGPEITFLVLFAVCVLLFLSNLGLCGAVGTAIHGFLRGMFGLMGYVFPVYLFVAVLFYQANRDNGKAVAKVAASIGVFLVFCGLAALLTTKDVDSSTTMKEYYVQAAETLNGGAVGGLFLNLLCPTIGTIGAYV